MDNLTKDSKLSVSGNLEIGKDAAVEINKGISSLGNNIGLAATVGAVATCVTKVISKTSLPPIQKIGIVLVVSIIDCGIHVLGNLLNKLTNNKINIVSRSFSGSNLANIKKKFI